MRAIFKALPLAFCAALSGTALADCPTQAGGGSGAFDAYSSGGHTIIRGWSLCPGQSIHVRVNTYGTNPSLDMAYCGYSQKVPGVRYTSGTSTAPEDPFQRALRYTNTTNGTLCFDVSLTADSSSLLPGRSYSYNFDYNLR